MQHSLSLKKTTKQPAVLLIAGSGPTDRNWLTPQLPGKNGSAAIIAKELAELGFVSLRYDKRGAGESPACNKYSWDTYLDEQKACLDFLSKREYVDSSSIFVMGHSEGALHALKLAQTSAKNSIRALVLLAGPAHSMREILITQLRKQLSPALPVESLEKELQSLTRGFDSIVNGAPIAPEEAATLPPLKDLFKIVSRKIENR